MQIKVPQTTWAYLTGFLIAVAYLVVLDAQLIQGSESTFVNWIPTIICAIGFILVNVVPKDNLFLDSDHEHDVKVVYFARAWLFFGLFIVFGGVISGSVIMIVDLVDVNKKMAWCAVAPFLHSLFACIATFIFFVGRVFGKKLRCGESDEDFSY
ncbi:predicted protein [Naegleria gruberi]|uniref:Predicted protein n=1 Tax=Naegleria gruberi TaxID=5762 RepID=D2VGV2_NAEGR|nr:uncharacterized protein NAEGRDRAFT_68107 [Naegleria gruberi]EFC44126.1 predicted protein [Naegleria gruberi]|eukprot:XP_002676870.1 predicted protein [Naegleria gruberi strain NEG-M]